MKHPREMKLAFTQRRGSPHTTTNTTTYRLRLCLMHRQSVQSRYSPPHTGLAHIQGYLLATPNSALDIGQTQQKARCVGMQQHRAGGGGGVLGGGRERRRRGGRGGGGCKGGKQKRQSLPCSKIDCVAEMVTRLLHEWARKKKEGGLALGVSRRRRYGYCKLFGTRSCCCRKLATPCAASGTAAASSASSLQCDDCIIIVIQSAHIHTANASQRNLKFGHAHARTSLSPLLNALDVAATRAATQGLIAATNLPGHIQSPPVLGGAAAGRGAPHERMLHTSPARYLAPVSELSGRDSRFLHTGTPTQAGREHVRNE